jgi:pimeloyl-ACP methyl ester carboxylesterase
VVVDGVRTYYRVEGQGPPLVLLHGLGMSHLTWRACAESLARSYTVVTLDLPGFGYSDKPAGWASARDASRFVDSFLSTLHMERVTLVGHSMGGATAVWLAANRPERVERLVLINAAEFGRSAAIFRVFATPIVGELVLKLTSPPSMRFLLRGAYLHKELVTWEVARTYARFGWSPGARQALIGYSRAYDADRAALRRRLGHVMAPTLVIWTEHDPYFPLAIGRELVEALPSATLGVVADAGHLPQEEQPERVSQLIVEWLTQARSATLAGACYEEPVRSAA